MSRFVTSGPGAAGLPDPDGEARRLSRSGVERPLSVRIEALDPKINAVVVRDFDRARAAADTKQKAPVRHLIDRGDELGRLDPVALLHQGQK